MRSKAAAVAAWESLFRAQVSVLRSPAQSSPTDEISLNEYDVLFTLSREPGRRMRLRDLNTRVLLTQPSVSRLVDRLVSRGLIVKTPEYTDGRGTMTELTEDGFNLFRRVAVGHIACITERVGGILDRDELALLTTICNKLRTA